jgi:hypothetical protein
MAPTNQRFKTDQIAFGKTNKRLIKEFKLPIFQGEREITRQGQGTQCNSPDPCSVRRIVMP